MRHRVFGRKLGRDKDHRKSLLRNLSASLIVHGKIETTLEKAKFVRPYVEKLVTKAKSPSHHSVEVVRSKLPDEKALKVLFEEVAPRFTKRAGGYTRIVRLGSRDGDNAEMVRMSWVEESKDKEEKKKSEAKKQGKEISEKVEEKVAKAEEKDEDNS